jgi:hypothetical protein
MGNRQAPKGMVGFVAIIIAFLTSTYAPAACKPPAYRIGWMSEDPSDHSGVELNIGIHLQDFAPERLICLASSLRSRYSGRNITALIFSSVEAARYYSPVTIDQGSKIVESQAALHGYYSYRKDNGGEYLALFPDATPRNDFPFTTRIDLPATAPPVCKLAVGRRCLLKFQHIFYPEADAPFVNSGAVTVAGNIRKDGVVSDVAVVESETDPVGRQADLAKWVKQQLSTWYFEPATQKDRIRITFRFVIADGPVPQQTRFQLPDEVTIQTARPPR